LNWKIVNKMNKKSSLSKDLKPQTFTHNPRDNLTHRAINYDNNIKIVNNKKSKSSSKYKVKRKRGKQG